MISGADRKLNALLASLEMWCGKAEAIASGSGFDEFERDEIRHLAVSKAVEQVGELAGRLLSKWPDFVRDNPEMRLADAYAMRNRLVHGYDQVDLGILYKTACTAIPELRRSVIAVLGDP
ncbi:HepT-like ribonuclease domain-containing protein [Hoeflea ulvae]|uniref:DUF86 domain-containing protein n=1 Tax=Hoeflea ulvae TaxID=2983764 RepID=A0ABT3YH16_9HYPH|nr:DUF86 domain-containing protein [Hoeflea ulvae]MCY0095097.1 DUF86 domain-containing protein [Hoeflea ulvae]